MRYEIELEIVVTADEIRAMVAEKCNNSRHDRMPLFVEAKNVAIQADGSAVVKASFQRRNETAWWSQPQQLSDEEKRERHGI